MLKKTISIFLVFVFILSSTFGVFAVVPTSIESPKNLSLRENGGSIIDLRWTNPASIMKVLEDIDNSEYSGNLAYLVDWKENDGEWHTAIPSSDPNFDDDIHGQFYGYVGGLLIDEGNVSETFYVIWHLFPEKSPADTYDLVNNTYYFRMRYILEPKPFQKSI